MNLILLFAEDFADVSTVRLTGRRMAHVTAVHRAAVGDSLVVGVEGAGVGHGVITRLDSEALEMEVVLDAGPPPKLDVTLVLALPRPKVLNRVIASATSMGVRAIYLINAWKVEKSYWSSPRLSEENLLLQRVLGLEQARDTILPRIELRRLFRAFVEEELPLLPGGTRVVAHPGAPALQRPLTGPVVLAVGPEGGFIDQEIASLQRAGFSTVGLGPRILRVETAVPVLLTVLHPARG